jgi:hypothetical protein
MSKKIVEPGADRVRTDDGHGLALVARVRRVRNYRAKARQPRQKRSDIESPGSDTTQREVKLWK